MTAATDEGLSVVGADGVLLTLELAGPGSRALAAAVDLPHLALPVVLAVDGGWLLAGKGAPLGAGVLGGCAALSVLYGVLSEQLGSGQTLGGRVLRLRVVDAAGRPPQLLPSVVRNLLRLLDALPALYAVAVVATVLRGRRLGDLAADTWVVRQRPAPSARTTAAPWPVPVQTVAALRLEGVGPEQRAVLLAFLSRRAGLSPAVRAALAGQLVEVLAPHLRGVPDGLAPEALLEAAAARLTSG